MTVTADTGFTEDCQEALAAVLDAIATVGQDRRSLLADAKLAIDMAIQAARGSEQWYLAENLRRTIKDVEARAQAVA